MWPSFSWLTICSCSEIMWDHGNECSVSTKDTNSLPAVWRSGSQEESEPLFLSCKTRERPLFCQQRGHCYLSGRWLLSHALSTVRYSIRRYTSLCTRHWEGSACSIYLCPAVVPTKPLIQLQPHNITAATLLLDPLMRQINRSCQLKRLETSEWTGLFNDVLQTAYVSYLATNCSNISK